MHAATQSSPIAAYCRDLRADRYEHLNPAIVELTGYSAAEMASMPLDEAMLHIHPDDRRAVTEAFENAKNTGQLTVEYRFKCKDGHYRWLADYATMRIDEESGAPLYLDGIVRDISRQKQTEELALTSERQWRLLYETMLQGVIYRDANGRILEMNHAAEGILGRSSAEVAGQLFIDSEHRMIREDGSSLPPEQHPSMVALRTGREVRDVTMGVYNLRDDEYRWIGVSAVPLVREGEDRPYQVYTLFDDITERKRVEDSLHRVQQDLQHKEATLRGIFEHTFQFIGLLSPGGVLLEANRAALDFVAAKSEDVVGKPFWETPWWAHDPDLKRRLRRAIDEAARGQFMRFEVTHHDADGRVAEFDFSLTPIKDERDEAIFLVAEGHDITERKHAEAALVELTKTLEQRVADATAEVSTRASQLQALALQLTMAEERERRRLAQVLHDDLQQLLVAARMHLDALLSVGVQPPRLQSNVVVAQELIAQSIATSRSLTAELSPAVLYDSGLCSALEWLARREEEKYGLRIVLQLDRSAEPSDQDLQVLLFQSVRELLFNVVKHAAVKSAFVQLRAASDDQLELIVEDSGRGFDPLESKKLQSTATGLGLFSLKERLGWLGGSVEIESKPGHGTRVSLCAPVHRSVASPRELPVELTVAAAPA